MAIVSKLTGGTVDSNMLMSSVSTCFDMNLTFSEHTASLNQWNDMCAARLEH